MLVAMKGFRFDEVAEAAIDELIFDEAVDATFPLVVAVRRTRIVWRGRGESDRLMMSGRVFARELERESKRAAKLLC